MTPPGISDPPMDQVIEKLPRFDSATVANAIEHFEVRDPTTGCADNRLVCQTPGIAAPMVGRAFTCKVDTTTPGDLLLGDGSGLVSVPLEIAADVAARAEEVRGQEEEFFRFLQGDGFSVKELKHRFDPRTEDWT